MEKNLDLIAYTPARYRRFSRKCSWAASKEIRAHGLVRSASLSRAFCPWCSVLASAEKRLFLPASITISAFKKNSYRNGRDYDLKQIENAFRDPEDGFWEKNSLKGIVGSSEVY